VISNRYLSGKNELNRITAQIACDRAEHIRDHCQSIMIDVEEQRVTVTVSIGVALFPEHGSNPDDLLHAADKALYAAKAKGRNCVQMIQ
jgi:diguanylate cyclase (GGDEF)-like protein